MVGRRKGTQLKRRYAPLQKVHFMRTIVFDLDGTLADTSGDLLAAANHCFRELGHGDVLMPETDAGTALRGSVAMLTLGFQRLGIDVSEAELDIQRNILLAAYDRAIDHHTVLYPGAREAVARLKSVGHRVAICTNKPANLAEKLMRNLNFRTEFHALIGADTLPVRKPNPAPLIEAIKLAGGDREQSVLIGDTLTDHNTSRAAGVPSVLVTFGPGDDDVRDLQPDALLHHFDDLDAVLDTVFSDD